MRKYGTIRRAMLASAAATLGAQAALATPPLSVANFGLKSRDVSRGNAWFEIDASAFEHNIAQARAILGPGGAELCAIRRADAYGNGMDLELETNSSAYGPDILAVMGNSLPKMLKA